MWPTYFIQDYRVVLLQFPLCVSLQLSVCRCVRVCIQECNCTGFDGCCSVMWRFSWATVHALLHLTGKSACCRLADFTTTSTSSPEDMPTTHLQIHGEYKWPDDKDKRALALNSYRSIHRIRKVPRKVSQSILDGTSNPSIPLIPTHFFFLFMLFCTWKRTYLYTQVTWYLLHRYSIRNIYFFFT